MNPPPPNPWLDALPAPKPITGPHNTAPGDLLLHLGEAWFPPAPAVLASLADIGAGIARYPDSLSTKLRAALAAYCGHGITPERVIVGNGSDWLIDLLVTTYAGPERAVVAPMPTFFVYGASAALRRAPLLTAGRRNQAEGFAFDADAVPKDAGVIFIASPNNPTGDLIPTETIARIAGGTRALVVVDECYHEFAGETAMGLLAEFPNVVILRSLSKSFALAGLRIGYAVAHPEIIATLAKVDQTFSVNIAAQHCALAALNALAYYRPLFARTIALRAQWQSALENAGLRVFPSRANILLAEYSATRGNLAATLRARSVHVADFHERPGIRNAIRVTVDDEAALTRFVTALAN